MEIFGKRVKLRAVEERDNKILRELINDPEIESKTGGWSFPVSEINQRKWCENLANNSNNLNLVITEISDSKDKCIGMVNVTNIDWKNRNAFCGIKLISEVRGKGIGKDALLAIMNYCFKELNLNRLDTTILERNIPSLKLFTQKCGWEQEGIKKEAIYKNGKFQNNILLGITHKEYDEFLKKENKI